MLVSSLILVVPAIVLPSAINAQSGSSNVICVPFDTAGCLQSCLALNGRNHPHTALSVFCMNVGCLPKMESIAIPKLNEQEQS